MYNLKKIAIVLSLVAGLFIPSTIHAQVSYTNYIWQYLSPQSVQADDLKLILESEVKKIIAAGHLAPFRALYGEGAGTNGQYYWYHSYDVVYTLSLAYPYVSSQTQSSIKTYLASEMQKYPLWNETFLDPNVGTKREPDELLSTERGPLPGYSLRPKAFALYALWLYAQNTGDWNYINTNWSNITSFYSRNKSEVSKYYTSISGAVGLARMAQQKTPSDATTKNTAVTDATTGFINGANFSQFGTNAETAYKFNSGEDWTYTRNGTYMGFQFLDITPEIGRYIFDNTTLSGLVLGTSTASDFSVTKGEYRYPVWYMAQAPANTVYFGEGSGNPPDTRAMIFPIHAWVMKDNATKLRKFIDVPDALLGDFFYIQNVVRTIESSGQECWKDILTGAVNCLGPGILTSAGPSSTPDSCPTDINLDRVTDISDFSILSQDYSQISPSNIRADINKDGVVDISDYSLLSLKYSLACQ